MTCDRDVTFAYAAVTRQASNYRKANVHIYLMVRTKLIYAHVFARARAKCAVWRHQVDGYIYVPSRCFLSLSLFTLARGREDKALLCGDKETCGMRKDTHRGMSERENERGESVQQDRWRRCGSMRSSPRLHG